MSEKDDNTSIDNELKAYLAGKDGVSAAYRQTGTEEPPEELDRLILAAARSTVTGSAVDDSVKHHAPRKIANLQQKFPLAASFMVGVLITSMYFNQTGDIAGDAGSSNAVRDQLITQTAEQPAPAPAPALAPAAPTVVVQQESESETLERVAAQQAGQSTQQAARSAADTTQATPEAAATKTASSQDSALAGNATEARDAATDPGAEAQESARPTATAVNIASPAVPTASEVTRAETDTAGVQLEEIQVTGSRIKTAEDLGYRESQQAWLERILAIGEDIIFQTGALEENNSRLEEEMELFSEAYPDVDVEAELQNLGTE